METTLHSLIDSLKSTSLYFKGDARHFLHALLHDTEKLPDQKLTSLVSEALDLLSEIRLNLEPSHLVLADHFLGYMSTKALCAAVELRITYILSFGSKTLPQLASECNARDDRLRQVMRTLHNNGIFSYEVETDTYRNNSTSTLLMSDHWTQWRNWVEFYGNKFYDMARGIPHACRNDAVRSPAQIHFDTDDTMFKYFTDQGWIHKFQKTLSGGAVAQAAGILQDSPWEDVAATTVIDVGGGSGGLIALLLRKHKSMKGAIFDVPKVIEQAKCNFHDPEGQYADVGGHVPLGNLIGGDFFVEVPSSDVYTMKWCLHDWTDEKACIILKNIRKPIRKSSRNRLLILESVLKDGHMGRMSRYADLNMMVAVGGAERDGEQWRRLAENTGWKLKEIYPLRNAWPCAIEFVPIWPPEDVSQKKGQKYLPAPENFIPDMSFLEPWDAANENPYIRIDPAPGFDRSNFKWQKHTITIQDARPSKKDLTLDTHGFAYFEDGISERVVNALRGDDTEVVKNLYYRHVEESVQGVTGAKRIVIFDHTLRKRRPELDKAQNVDGKEQPATMVHCDQSSKGALRRLKMNIDNEENVDKVLQSRVQMIKFGVSIFEYYQQNPDKGIRFGHAMEGSAKFDRKVNTLRDDFDWQALWDGTVVDVGGANGATSIVLAKSFPKLRFVVQDNSNDLLREGENTVAEDADVKDRITFKQYSFFDPQPLHTVAAFIIRQCLHNWNDHDCVKILRSFVPAMEKCAPGTPLLINEIILPDPGERTRWEEQRIRQVDISMLVLLGSRQRTASDWNLLLKTADSRFHIAGVHGVSSPGLLEVHLRN